MWRCSQINARIPLLQFALRSTGDINYAGSANGAPEAAVAIALSSDPAGDIVSGSIISSSAQYWMDWAGHYGPYP